MRRNAVPDLKGNHDKIIISDHLSARLLISQLYQKLEAQNELYRKGLFTSSLLLDQLVADLVLKRLSVCFNVYPTGQVQSPELKRDKATLEVKKRISNHNTFRLFAFITKPKLKRRPLSAEVSFCFLCLLFR